jgi:hypothetical protein
MIQTQKEEERLIERIQSSKGLEFTQKGSPRKIISSEMDKKVLQKRPNNKPIILINLWLDVWEITHI